MQRALRQVEPPHQHSRRQGCCQPSTPHLRRGSPGGAFASSAEENAEREAKLCPRSSRAATAAERQG